MPSYVIVWENNTLGHRKVSGSTWPGHAAINIGGEFSHRDGGNLSYVSYWPGGTANFSAKGAVFTPTSKAQANGSIVADIECECYYPDHVILLPTDAAKERQMMAAWKAIFSTKTDGPSYKTLRKNCSTICSRILHAGGYYGKSWAVNNNWVWTPADIARLAVSAGGRRMQWPGFVDVLGRSGIDLDGLTDTRNRPITAARSGAFCTTGAPVRFQPDGYRMAA